MLVLRGNLTSSQKFSNMRSLIILRVEMPDHRTKALLVSVGESPEPVINTIHELRPECLCFFASEEARSMINNDIIPKLVERPPWMAEIVIGDAHDLLACYKAITGRWTELQKNWRLEPGDWTVDYTGGTKPMVAALVLATADDSSGYRHAGRQINPWDELAIRERHEAAILFGRGISTSDVQPEQIPQEVRSEFAGKYLDNVDNRIRLPLYGSYKILELLKDPAGLAFIELWPQIKLLLDSRNKTILAYGLEPVKRERFEEMLKLACRISGVNEGAIPGFPDIIL